MVAEGNKASPVAPVSAKLTPIQTQRIQTLRRLGLLNTDTAAFARHWVDQGIEHLLKTHGLSILHLDKMGRDPSLTWAEAAWTPPDDGTRRNK